MDLDIRYQPTWEDDIAEYDFIAFHGNHRIGRITVWPAGGWDVRWQWSARFPTIPIEGHHESQRAAMLELERRYVVYLETEQIDDHSNR